MAAKIEAISSKSRSRVTNASMALKEDSSAFRSLLLEGDARSAWARRWRDLVELYAADCGGFASLSELRLSFIRRAASLSCECERLESQLANGEQVDSDQLARIAGHFRRISETLGLDRVKRDAAPTLAELIAAEKAKQAQTLAGQPRAKHMHQARRKAAKAALDGDE